MGYVGLRGAAKNGRNGDDEQPCTAATGTKGGNEAAIDGCDGDKGDAKGCDDIATDGTGVKWVVQTIAFATVR